MSAYWWLTIWPLHFTRICLTCAGDNKLHAAWEANCRSGCQEILPSPFFAAQRFIILFRKAHHWSQLNPIHILRYYFFKIHFKIILRSASRNPSDLFPAFSEYNYVCVSRLSHACYMSNLFPSPWFYHPNNSDYKWIERFLSITLCNRSHHL